MFAFTIGTKVATKLGTSVRMIITSQATTNPHALCGAPIWRTCRQREWLHNPDHVLKMLYLGGVVKAAGSKIILFLYATHT